MKAATVAGSENGSKKCLLDELSDANIDDTITTFTNNYKNIKDYQRKAFNHISCIGMDEYIQLVNEVVTIALTGFKDQFKEQDLATAFLQEEVVDLSTMQGECREEVRCEFPDPSNRVIPIDTLLNEAIIPAGCDEVTERFAMIGQKSGLSLRLTKELTFLLVT